MGMATWHGAPSRSGKLFRLVGAIAEAVTGAYKGASSSRVSACGPSHKLSVRILSTVGLLVVFGLTAYDGFELFSYQSLSDRVSTKLVHAKGTPQRISETDKSAISSWLNVTGVSGWARGLLLAVFRADTPDDKVAIENASAEAAEVSPTWAAGWQDLAASRLAKSREGALEQATGQGGLNGDAAVQLRELERTAAVNKSLFEDFLQKAKITEEQGTFRARDARIIMPAQPGVKSFPRTGYVLMIALVLGLGLGVGGATAMEMLNTGFTTPSQVEDALGVPVLASVRQLEKSTLVNKDGAAIPPPLYQVHYPLSPFSEAMRTLRSGIHMSDVDRPPKIIHVTSARPGEGKTTIAISLAISAAFSGLKVALVDADLRHPSASRFFRMEKEKGLVDLLTGNADPDEVLIFRKDLKLMITPAGRKSLNPPPTCWDRSA
jgi:hypothetical protein